MNGFSNYDPRYNAKFHVSKRTEARRPARQHADTNRVPPRHPGSEGVPPADTPGSRAFPRHHRAG
jgi:hypothetical protein